jgi:hypothetical protein
MKAGAEATPGVALLRLLAGAKAGPRLCRGQRLSSSLWSGAAMGTRIAEGKIEFLMRRIHG